MQYQFHHSRGTYNIPKLSPNPIVVNARLQRRATCLPISSVRSSDFRSPGWLHLVNCSLGAQTRTATRTRSKGICNKLHMHFIPFNLSGTQHPFTMALGGGLDIKVSTNFSIRPIEIDYILTRYTNPLTSTNNQNSFRYSAGGRVAFLIRICLDLWSSTGTDTGQSRFFPGRSPHANTYQKLFKAIKPHAHTTANPSNNALDFVMGGGADIPVTKSIPIRPVQFDFVLIRFDNSFHKGNQNQSNFRYQGGLFLGSRSKV